MFSWWAVCGDLESILSFDMSNEVFLTTLLPDDNSMTISDDNWTCFFGFNELVSVVNFIKGRKKLETCFHIWSLLEFGVRESWTKLFSIGPLMGIDKPLGFWKNDSMFLRNDEGQLVLYDPSTQEMTNLQIDEYRNLCR